MEERRPGEAVGSRNERLPDAEVRLPRPLIGITGTRHVIASNSAAPGLMGLVSGDDYAQGVERAGGLPVVIPYIESEDVLDDLANRLDGLLLAGGEDVNPELWGSEPLRGLGQVIPERDALERVLILRMLEQNKPILGICRGIQMLNVALGGSLYQDIVREWRGVIQHRQQARRDHLSHSVRIVPDSRLFQLVGHRSELRCNSFHHQAVKELGKDLVAVAWDQEGLVEAIEHTKHDFVLGVQWHPENLWRQYPEHFALFQGLVRAAQMRSVS
jgi:putative glutamine amidotransferase